jgi:hypothetical protein
MKVVRLTASSTGRPYPQDMFLVLIFTRGWVDPWAMERSEGDMSLKNPVTPPGIDPGTVRLVAQRLNHYAIPGPHGICIISNLYFFTFCYRPLWSRDSVLGIATHYELESPGIESRWGEIFRTYPGRLRGPPSLLYNGYRVFPGGKGGRGVTTTHPLLVPRLRKSWAIPPLILWVLLGLLRGSLYL